MEAQGKLVVAGIDVHKQMLAVVLVEADRPQQELARAKFGTTVEQIDALADWLEAHGVRVVVMESTAKYWCPVWLGLESRFLLHLAQAQSNAAPRGRKTDYADALRLARRFLAAELKLSFVADAEQRQWRCLARGKHQLRRQRVLLQNQVEAMLEEGRIKLSSVITDLLGVTGWRILSALAEGETDPHKLASLADPAVKASPERIAAALKGELSEVHRTVLKMKLEQLALIDQHITKLQQKLWEALEEHREAIARLCEIPGIKEDSAMQMIAEIGPEAAVFETPQQMASWIGVCPGQNESAGQSKSNRSPKGNRTMRRLINQAAWGAVRTKGSYYEDVFTRLKPRLGTHKAIWAVAHKVVKVVWIVLHRKTRYIERGPRAMSEKAMKRRVSALEKKMRKLGYTLEVKPLVTA